ncbi:hypothetical protein F9K96_22490 [Brucella anthropi]|nr:hypothetical protein F9K96_22490 [Brucella anthropi]
MIATVITPSFSRSTTEPRPRAYALTFVLTYYPQQNRFALLLEMLHYTNSARDGYSPHSEKSKTALSYQKAFQMKKRRD